MYWLVYIFVLLWNTFDILVNNNGFRIDCKELCNNLTIGCIMYGPINV